MITLGNRIVTGDELLIREPIETQDIFVYQVVTNLTHYLTDHPIPFKLNLQK